MKHYQKQYYLAVFTAALVFATVGVCAAQVEINNGGITVHSPNGKTTRITNGGVQTGSASTGGSRARVSITGNSLHRTIAANGHTVEIAGNSNNLTVTGYCPRLLVSGNSNQITARNVAVIDATGNRNKIRWQRSPSRSGKPAVRSMGNQNTVQRF